MTLASMFKEEFEDEGVLYHTRITLEVIKTLKQLWFSLKDSLKCSNFQSGFSLGLMNISIPVKRNVIHLDMHGLKISYITDAAWDMKCKSAVYSPFCWKILLGSQVEVADGKSIRYVQTQMNARRGCRAFKFTWSGNKEKRTKVWTWTHESLDMNARKSDHERTNSLVNVGMRNFTTIYI